MTTHDNTVRPGSIAAFIASPFEVLSHAIDLQDAAAAESVLANCLRSLDNPEQNKKGALICDDNGSLAWVRIDVYPQPPSAEHSTTK